MPCSTCQAPFADARNLANKRAIGDMTAVITAGGANYYPVERRSLFMGVRTRW